MISDTKKEKFLVRIETTSKHMTYSEAEHVLNCFRSTAQECNGVEESHWLGGFFNHYARAQFEFSSKENGMAFKSKLEEAVAQKTFPALKFMHV